MRFFVRKLLTLLLLLTVAALVAFMLPLRGGKPLLDWHALELSELSTSRLPDWIGDHEHTSPRQITIYRWRDSAGIWQYGAEPPADGTAYESRRIDSDTNTALFPPLPPTQEPALTQGTPQPAPAAPYRRDVLHQLFENAHRLRDKSQERQDPPPPQ